MTFIDIVRTVAILVFGMLTSWIIYRLMKNADADEDDEDKENNKKGERK